ncbi:MAG: hypothetical protein E7626_03840 [Ruminococcaceae bacterium]|nr:hypothetical protein [Oscillospiraceae bacterium]
MPEKKRTLKIAVAVLIFILCLPISSAAKDETLGSDLGNAVDTLPQGIKDSLPEGFEEELSSPEELSKLFGVDYLFSLSAGLFKSALSAALKTFASVAAAIVISALVSNIANAFSSGGAGVQTVNLATSLCISSCAYIMIWSHVRGVIDFSGNISTFMKALTVAMGAVYTSVGELGSAGVHGAWVFSLTTVTEELCSGLLLPLMQISFSATLVSSISSGVNINRFVQTLRNVFTSFLVFFMTVISVILSFQTVIAHTSDSVTMRGVRYAVFKWKIRYNGGGSK